METAHTKQGEGIREKCVVLKTSSGKKRARKGESLEHPQK